MEPFMINLSPQLKHPKMPTKKIQKATESMVGNQSITTDSFAKKLTWKAMENPLATVSGVLDNTDEIKLKPEKQA